MKKRGKIFEKIVNIIKKKADKYWEEHDLDSLIFLGPVGVYSVIGIIGMIMGVSPLLNKAGLIVFCSASGLLIFHVVGVFAIGYYNDVKIERKSKREAEEKEQEVNIETKELEKGVSTVNISDISGSLTRSSEEIASEKENFISLLELVERYRRLESNASCDKNAEKPFTSENIEETYNNSNNMHI